MEDKVDFRKRMLKLRNEIPKGIRLEKDRIIIERVLQSQAYWQAKTLLIYLSMGSEVATRPIIEQGLADGKKIGLPIALMGTMEMHFIQITDFNSLVKSTYGAMEPVFDEANIIMSDKDTLILVPGCGFDKEGYRMGYGGGYYDTYLSAHPSYKNMALAYEEQIVPAVPREDHDKKLDGLFTDKEAYFW